MRLASRSGDAVRRLLVVALIAWPLSQSAHARKIEPPDVFQNILIIRGELERIRIALGKPREQRAEIEIRDAQPREVFFQAITLWVKTERLCRESRGAGASSLARIHVAPPDDVTPRDVWTLTQNAIGRLSCVKRVLDLDGDVATPSRDDSKTPTDVFRSVVQANRQLNLLLEHPFNPSDVFAIVTLTNDYLVETMDKLSPGWRADEPKLPAHAGGKQPIDVYRQLTRCLAVIQRIAAHSDLDMLEFEADLEQDIVPSDVFDIASLVLSEVRYFASEIGLKKRYAFREFGKKVPADVYQLARWQEALLETFEALAKRDPKWHANN